MGIVRGGALAGPGELEAAMRSAGMIEPTHDERQAQLEAAFAEDRAEIDANYWAMRRAQAAEIADEFTDDDDPEQQEWVISGLPEDYDEPEDSPTVDNCDDYGTGEGRYHGRM